MSPDSDGHRPFDAFSGTDNFADDNIFEDGADDSQFDQPAVVATTCWRCDQDFDITLSECPLCAANNRSYSGVSQTREGRPPGQSPAIVRTVWAFIVLTGISIGFAIVGAIVPSQLEPGTLPWARQVFVHIGLVEFLDTVVVIAALFMIRVRPQWPSRDVSHRTIAWVMSVPLLAVVLAINLGYHYLLRASFGVEDSLGTLTGFPELWPWILVTICLQPAIVEELFFRHVTLGAALEVTPAGQAVFISSILFALAHLGTPVSIPTLTLLGIVLGALRLASGGLLLPMLFHFFHNLIITLLEV